MTNTGGVDQARWSVGAVAKATGLTVRTLHHYDELGLLTPSARTHSGHRRYTERDLNRLFQIRLLRRLGMSLESIGEALADPDALREVLDRRIEELDDELWRLTVLRREAGALVTQLDGGPDVLVRLGRTSIFNDSLTRAQEEAFAARSESLGADDWARLDEEWPQVLSALIAHYQAGDPVDAPEVRAAVGRLRGIMRDFAGDDTAVVASAGEFFRAHGLEMLRVSDVDERVWEYVSRAVTANS